MRRQNPRAVGKIREATEGKLGNAEGTEFGRVTKLDVVDRLLELAKLPPKKTRGNITGQVNALKAIIEIKGYVVNRREDLTKEFAGRTVEEMEFFAAHGYRQDEVESSQPGATGSESQSPQLKAAEALKDPRIAQALEYPYLWATNYTETYNQHWLEEGRPSPYEPFPRELYLAAVFELLAIERIVWWEKSRDMMLSWACVAYLTCEAQKVAEREILFQTQKEDKAVQLVNYAKCLYRRQPNWLQAGCPLTKPLLRQPKLALEFANGSRSSASRAGRIRFAPITLGAT